MLSTELRTRLSVCHLFKHIITTVTLENAFAALTNLHCRKSSLDRIVESNTMGAFDASFICYFIGCAADVVGHDVAKRNLRDFSIFQRICFHNRI